MSQQMRASILWLSGAPDWLDEICFRVDRSPEAILSFRVSRIEKNREFSCEVCAGRPMGP